MCQAGTNQTSISFSSLIFISTKKHNPGPPLEKTMKSKRQIIYEKALPYAKENFKKIDVRMGDYDGSKKCQHVARHQLELGNYDYLAVTLSFVPNSGVNIHFINHDEFEGYTDDTLGYLSKRNTYYLIKEFTLEEIEDKDMNKMLLEYKEEILDRLFTSDQLSKLQIELKDI